MQNISLQYVLEQAFLSFTSNFYTAIPCIVLTVYNEGNDQRIDVQPCINRLSTEGDTTEQPPILSVPVIFPSSSTSAFTFPINKEDTILCVFSQRSMEVFLSSSGFPAAPNNYRRFDKNDAIAIPGLFPFGKAINNPSRRTLSHSTSDAVLVHNIGTANECEVRLKANGQVIVNSPTKWIMNAPEGEINCENLVINSDTEINGNVNTTGTLFNNSKNVGSTHTHSGVQTGGGNTGVPN